MSVKTAIVRSVVPYFRIAPVAAAVFTVALGVAANPAAKALGFGQVSPFAVLGQRLDYTVPLHLDASEEGASAADCVSAAVVVGDHKLPAHEVSLRVERSGGGSDRLLRITTRNVVDEPVISISVSAGCHAVVSRTFQVLMDPAELIERRAVVSAPVIMGSNKSTAVAAAVDQGDTVSPARTAESGATAPRHAAGGKRSKHKSSHSRAGSGDAAVNALGEPPARSALPVATAGSGVAPRVSKAAHKSRAKPSEAQSSVETARLRLDAWEQARQQATATQAAASAAPALGASAAEATAQAVNEEMQRVQALEASIAQLRKDVRASREAAAQLRTKLGDIDEKNQAPWLLYGAVGLMAMGVGLLSWRLRRLNADANAAQWWDGDADVQGPLAVAKDELAQDIDTGADVQSLDTPDIRFAKPKPKPVREEQADSGWDQPAPNFASTMPLDQPAVVDSGYPGMHGHEPREVSVEELIDLEQQAEFFMTLGQTDAAVGLLVDHLRETGGASPLPYLKLLDVYRRISDKPAYDRIRTKFNRRFNAYAPGWDEDLAAGRTLAQYPTLMSAVEASWPVPLDAMAMLEALLFGRNDEAGVFDLPAYREVLFLYAVARDLYDHTEAGPTVPVDVLLPIGEYSTNPPVEPLDVRNAATAVLPGAPSRDAQPQPPVVTAATAAPTPELELEAVDVDVGQPPESLDLMLELPDDERPSQWGTPSQMGDLSSVNIDLDRLAAWPSVDQPAAVPPGQTKVDVAI